MFFVPPAHKMALHSLDGTRHGIACIREWGPDLFGRARNRWRVIRTSNAYTFVDPQPQTRPPNSSKSELPTGTGGQELHLVMPHTLDRENPPLRQARCCGSEKR
jgi:hypothetical protein